MNLMDRSYRYAKISQSSTNLFNRTYSPNPINEPKAGISFDNLSLNDKTRIISKELKCGICLNLLWNPIEIEKCGHVFCKYCLNQKKITKCPLCRGEIKTRPCKTFSRLLGEIKIKCNNYPCKTTPDYNDYLSHLQCCNYRLYHCKNRGCYYQDILSNMESHQYNCQYRIINCKYCNKKIQEYYFNTHEKTECSQKIYCPKCKTQMTRCSYLSKHQNNDNIECLKSQIENMKLEKEKQKKENDKLKNEIIILKDENSRNKKEINNIKGQLTKRNDAIKYIYQNMILTENEKQINNDILMTPKIRRPIYESSPFETPKRKRNVQYLNTSIKF